MRRALKLLILSVVLCGSIPGVALAAASPTVVTGAATKVTTSTAVLTGRVIPNGRRTTYAFAYGPTAAYGAATAIRSAGSGTKAVAVTRKITGLTPGTVYHYRISAISAAGAAVGADRTFKTKGHPPAAVVTGGLSAVSQTGATVTGVINPEGAPTTWFVQYGLSTAYTAQSVTQALPASNQSLPVSVALSGLTPGTTFHYRIVALHGSTVVSAGADIAFFTEPTHRPRPRLIAHTGPSRDRRSPYEFTTRGVLAGAGSIPTGERCNGNVGIRYYHGRRQLAFVVAPVGSDCRFIAPASFRRLHARGPVKLRVRVDYRGTGYVAPASRIDHVHAG